MAGRHVRIRHHNGATTRDTHGPPGYSAAIVAPPSVIQRDGEQQQLPDLGPGSVDTQQFYPTAKAPQVNNNPFDPGEASVTIDEDGLHVRDGAIFIEDLSGNSVLNAAGFRGSWLDFIATGIYNGTFAAGVGVEAIKPAREEVTSESDLPYWSVARTGGADSSNTKAYHASSDDADYLMEARLWAEAAPLDSYISLMQLVPLSHAISNRGNLGGGVNVHVPTRAVDANANYLFILAAVEYGFDPIENVTVALGVEHATSAGLGGTLWLRIPSLNPLTTHLLIEIRLVRLGLGDDTAVEGAVLNTRIVPSQRALLLEGLAEDLEVAEIYTTNAGSGRQRLELNPKVGGNAEDKELLVYGDLRLTKQGSALAQLVELIGSDGASSSNIRMNRSTDPDFRVHLGFDTAGTPSLRFGGGSVSTDVTLERLAAGTLGILGKRERGAGTSFPSSPVTNDQFYRTDRNLQYFYDGTRWLCTCPHVTTVSYSAAVVSGSTAVGRVPHPGYQLGYSIYIERVGWSAFILGSTSAVNYWELRLRTIDGAAAADIGPLPAWIAGQTNQTTTMQTAGVVVAPTVEALDIAFFKGGAAPNLADVGGSFEWRYVG